MKIPSRFQLLAAIALAVLALLAGCRNGEQSSQRLEEEIRGLAVTHSTRVAGLTMDVLLTKIYATPHWILSDDIYMRTDKVSLIYGFELPEKAISVEMTGGQGVLRVRARNARGRISVNRGSLRTMTNYGDYRLTVNEERDGRVRPVIRDIDEEFNREIDRLEEKYRAKNLEAAKNNLHAFFSLLAARHGLKLSLEFTDD
ncbi:MAG: hypothetical protein LBD82_06885 [Deltaproteobacteria bacterium]|jgi:hypothetical protein|nr:hypothetical protein [Deltaproteobacteria bacterium]